MTASDGVKVKPGLGLRVLKMFDEHPQTLRQLIAQLVAWLAAEDMLNLTQSDVARLTGLLKASLEFKVYHSGAQGEPLHVRLSRKSCTASLDLTRFLEEKDPEDYFGKALQNPQFTAEALPADEFMLDNWKDPDDPDRQPVAATKEEVLAKAAAMRDHARYLERLANGKTLEDGAMALLATARGHVITGPYEKVLSNIDDAIEALTDENAH